MVKKIGVVTSTRAEFGLLMPVIKELRQSENKHLKVELIVTGTHLYNEYGYTMKEIEKSRLRIDHCIKIPVSSESADDISYNQAETLICFTKLFAQQKYNAVILLGDRYEMLAIAIASGNTHTPIFHLCGGDTTEGAIDEWIRHSITKMSYLHFVTNTKSRDRVLQLGESPDRVFNYGSTSIDNILGNAVIPKSDALKSLGLKDCKYALCTYHPVTMEGNNVEYLIQHFLSAIKSLPEIQFIVTKSNADQGGAHINRLLDTADKEIKNLHVYSSLGLTKYLSLMKYADFVLGNSSSGIIEAPAFKVPTINIGDRQRGRIQSESIINCKPDAQSIIAAIDKAISSDFKESCKKVMSPYGDGHAAERIAAKVIQVILENKIDLKKKFYDFKGWIL